MKCDRHTNPTQLPKEAANFSLTWKKMDCLLSENKLSWWSFSGAPIVVSKFGGLWSLPNGRDQIYLSSVWGKVLLCLYQCKHVPGIFSNSNKQNHNDVFPVRFETLSYSLWAKKLQAVFEQRSDEEGSGTSGPKHSTVGTDMASSLLSRRCNCTLFLRTADTLIEIVCLDGYYNSDKLGLLP